MQDGEKQDQEVVDKAARDRAVDAKVEEIVDHIAAERLEPAMNGCRELLAMEPDYAPAVHLMGVIAFMTNDLGLAINLVTRAHELEEDYRDYALMLAFLEANAGRLQDSLFHAKLALALDPHPRHRRLVPGNIPVGAEVFDHVGVSAHRMIAELALDNGKYEEAAVEGERELHLTPDDLASMIVTGRARLALGHIDQALAHLRAAAHVEPRNAKIQLYLAEALLANGDHAAALAAARRATALAPEDEGIAARAIALLSWQEQAASLSETLCAGLESNRRPRTLTYGRYSSIAVVWDEAHLGPLLDFVLPVVRQIPEVIFYRLNRRNDAGTEALRATVMRLVDNYNQDSPTFDRIISGDRPRAVINLCHGTEDARYPLLSGEGAPLMLQWLGLPLPDRLPGVTGAIGSPETLDLDVAQFGADKVLELPRLLGWTFPATGVEEEAVVASPRDAFGVVTFGAIGDLRRITPATVALWAGVLTQVPNAQLLLGTSHDWQRGATARLLDMFANFGVANRVSLQTPGPARGVNLTFYNSIDLLLDTAPVSGLSEVAEALWMGVPVISLKGTRRAGRSAAAVLGAAGRGGWAAHDEAGYVRMAVDLATGTTLAGLRGELRDSVAASPLCDTKGLAELITKALDRMAPQVD